MIATPTTTALFDEFSAHTRSVCNLQDTMLLSCGATGVHGIYLTVTLTAAQQAALHNFLSGVQLLQLNRAGVKLPAFGL